METLQKRCQVCKNLMRGTKENYRYTECGLNTVFLKNIVVYHCDCGVVVPEIPNMASLHRVIVLDVLKKTTLLSGEEIRFIRKMAGLSSAELARFMGVHPVTVSKWENNAVNISASNDRVLRLLCFAGILQQMLRQKDDKFLGSVASTAREVSTLELNNFLERIEQKSEGPKTVTIDPSLLSDFECSEEDVQQTSKVSCN